ncbi:MAG: hypothetical protein ACTSRO_12710, partial [Candidatus Heimdallarchaeaceae archaeon]
KNNITSSFHFLKTKIAQALYFFHLNSECVEDKVYNYLKVLYSVKKVRRKILLPSLLIIIVGFGIGGYFLVSVIVRSSLSFSALYANNAYNLIDGIPAFIKGEHISFTFTLEKRGRPKIEWDNFVTNVSLYSEEYKFNITISYNSSSILESKDHEEYRLITLSIGPILNTTKGVFALNVGRYTIYDVGICYNSKKMGIKEQLDFPFFIINPPVKEQLTNNDFHENFEGWDLKQSLDNLSIKVVDQSPIGTKSLMAYTNQTIRLEINNTTCRFEKNTFFEF